MKLWFFGILTFAGFPVFFAHALVTNHEDDLLRVLDDQLQPNSSVVQLLLTYDTTTALMKTLQSVRIINPPFWTETEESRAIDILSALIQNITLCNYIPYSRRYHEWLIYTILKKFDKFEETVTFWNTVAEPKKYLLGITMHGLSGNAESGHLPPIKFVIRDSYRRCVVSQLWQNRGLEYIVTIKNDDSVLDGVGFIHTWLSIDGIEGDTWNRILFSFSNSPRHLLKAFPGISTAEIPLYYRPSKSLNIPITEQQYMQLKHAVANFYDSTPLYMLFPGHRPNVYNCVTASNAILSQAGINILAHIDKPWVVSDKINEELAKITDPKILQYY